MHCSVYKRTIYILKCLMVILLMKMVGCTSGVLLILLYVIVECAGKNSTTLLEPRGCIVVQKQSIGLVNPSDYYDDQEDSEEGSTSSPIDSLIAKRKLTKYLAKLNKKHKRGKF